MIYKLTFTDERIDWCTAKSTVHLLKSYDEDFGLPLQEVEDIEELSDEEAKSTLVVNSEYYVDNPGDMPEKLSLYDLAIGEDFMVIASTEDWW